VPIAGLGGAIPDMTMPAFKRPRHWYEVFRPSGRTAVMAFLEKMLEMAGC
jgi:hypothetical protein